nr:formylglycine-generating enzyme family protein [Reinekea blandensis]
MDTQKFFSLFAISVSIGVSGCNDQTPPKDSDPIDALIEKTLNNMVYVGGGSFMMGNIGYEVPEDDPNGTWITMEDGSKSYRVPFPGCSKSCFPIHKVNLSGFYINKYETTIGEYDVYTEANGLPMVYPERRELKSGNYLPDRPVYVGVDWHGANGYCQWLGEVTGLPFELPTEAQWEYAARSRGQAVRFATDTGELDFGRNSWDRHTGSFYGIDPVGSYPPNPLGLYDMTGNANEWVRDWYDPEIYEQGEQTNPTGPKDGDFWNSCKMSRGFGRQHSDASEINVYRRLPKKIDYTSGPGFRCSIDTDISLGELKSNVADKP